VALRGIDLHVPSGQFVALLGPSGCGKSTLLRIVSGLLEPSTGRVLLAGAPPSTARKRRAIGWLAQVDGLLPWRTVQENVDLPRRLAHRGELGAALAMLRRVWLESSAWSANPPPTMSFPFIIPAPSMSCAPTAAGSAARSKPTAAGPVAFPRARERYRPRCW